LERKEQFVRALPGNRIVKKFISRLPSSTRFVVSPPKI
jgi:hypothetical protein